MADSFTLVIPPLESDSPAPGTMLPAAQWAELHGVSLRSARRYLSNDALRGAEKRQGAWYIPAETTPPTPGSHTRPAGTELAHQGPAAAPAPRQARAGAEPTLEGSLATQPAYLDLETAARLLGVEPGVITRNPELFGAQRLGERAANRGRRAWLVPQATVRTTAGLVR